MKYILTGGGSGGHIYPALAIAEKIKSKEADAEFIYIGVRGRIEKEIVPKAGYKLYLVFAKGFPGSKPSLSLLIFLILNLLGIIKSLLIVLKYKPDMVVGTGGFGSAPVVFATLLAKKIFRYKTKIFLHEANAEPGKMVEFTGRFADGVGTVYRNCTKFFPKNGRYVGYPIRDVFQKSLTKIEKKSLLNSAGKFKILVFGGSQGSKVINDAIVKILPRIYSENIFIVHATGKDGKFYKAYSDTMAQVDNSGMSKSALEQCYDPHPYLEDIVQYYKSVDLVISRAGAGTISEIAVMGKPSILIPLSGLAGDHQVINGMYLKNIAAAEIVFEESDIKTGTRKVSPDTLFNKILELKENEHKRHYLVVNSAKAVENVGTEYIYLFIKSIAEGKSFDPKGETKLKNSFQQESFDSLQDVRPVQEFDMPYTRLSSLGILKLITKEGEVKENSLLWIYLQYKIDLYLSSKKWQIRNNGVKIITQLKDGRHIDKLSYLFNNRRRAKLSHRILGGDFEEVGFVRRNIMTAYRKIGIYNDTVESDLKKGLRDPYFEVAAEALRTLSFFSEKIRTNSGIHELVRETLFRKEFEVVMEAIKTFGYLINSIEEYSLLQRFYYHKSWKIREAVVITLKRIYKAKVVDEEFVKSELDKILITSSGFIPMFSLKNVIKDL